jgi:flavoprotein
MSMRKRKQKFKLRFKYNYKNREVRWKMKANIPIVGHFWAGKYYA